MSCIVSGISNLLGIVMYFVSLITMNLLYTCDGLELCVCVCLNLLGINTVFDHISAGSK